MTKKEIDDVRFRVMCVREGGLKRISIECDLVDKLLDEIDNGLGEKK